MSHLATARWTTALVLVAAAPIGAQLAGAAGVGASLQRQGGDLWQSITRLEPAARINNQWLQLGGTASFVSGDRQMRLENGQLDLIAETPSWNRFRLSTSAQIERHDALFGFARGGGTFESALTYGANGRGAWLGLGSEHPLRFLDTRFDDARMAPNGDRLLRMGLWQQIGRVSLVLGASQHQAQQSTVVGLPSNPSLPDSIGGGGIIPDSGRRVSALQVVRKRWSESEARVMWAIGAVAIDGQFGFQRVDSTRSGFWGRATATMALNSRLSLVGGYGTRPARDWLGMPGGRFASLGLRIAPASLSRPSAPAHVQPTANRFIVRSADSGLYVVTIGVPHARTVELSGDFNAWQPVALRETRPDVWEATVPLGPGTYHVNMRVNGAEWVAPPGLSETSDDFNGTVGILVVR